MIVVIKDMEMPERCMDCRFYQDKWCYAYMDSDGSRFKYLGGSKPKFCPLVSLESFNQVRGKWIGKPIGGYSTVKCSVCGEAYLNNSGKWRYCPNCGARMEE